MRGKATRHTLSDRERQPRRPAQPADRPAASRACGSSTGDDRLTINLDRTKTEITVDSKGTVTIKGSRSVAVKAGGNLSLSAGGLADDPAAAGRSNISGGGIVNAQVACGALDDERGGRPEPEAVGAAMLTAGATVQVSSDRQREHQGRSPSPIRARSPSTGCRYRCEARG